MGLLEVDTVGLRMLAAHCQSWAVEVGTTSVPDFVGLSCQATSAAVSAVHAEASMAGEALASRMLSTAAKLTAASDDYSVRDESSWAGIRDVTVGL